MTKAKKGIAARRKIAKRGKATAKPASMRPAKRAIAKSSSDHDRVVALAARVDQMLWAANDDRRKVLSRETLASLLEVIVSGEELAWARSSSATSGYEGWHLATFALSARTSPNELIVAITSGPASRGSPGRAWPDLQPWRPNTRKMPERLKRWLGAGTRVLVRLSIKEAKAVAKELTKLPPPETKWWPHLDTKDNGIIVVKNQAKTLSQ